MRLPGLKLAQHTFRRVRSRLLGGIAVLGYHRLGDGHDPFALNVSARRFEAQIAVIVRRTRVMRLSEAVRAAANGAVPPRAVVITFDDGYADTCATVLPVLERAGVPATVFVTTGRPGEEFWWDELSRIMDAETIPDRLEIAVDGCRRSWDLGQRDQRRATDGLAARRRMLSSVADLLRPLRPADRDAAMCQVRAWAGEHAAKAGGSPRALTTSELQRLAASPQIEIAAHTISHPVLSALTAAEQRREIEQSRIHLQRITGMPVTSFSYPNGAYTAETLSIVAEAGFTIACCSALDVVSSRSHPLALPRLWVGDHDADTFDAWLSRWLHD